MDAAWSLWVKIILIFFGTFFGFSFSQEPSKQVSVLVLNPGPHYNVIFIFILSSRELSRRPVCGTNRYDEYHLKFSVIFVYFKIMILKLSQKP